ncbi:ATP-binding protein PRP16 [Fusarium mundagurra]|uniref:ATP-binding protein PRP16 n=1 Tax=Fusarium mundagurra TaxID=1567541 RepID=A0A8H5YEL3_9HYPO|nr:ATP-binding protein PRP16 [Fusarium mundagurra]
MASLTTTEQVLLKCILEYEVAPANPLRPSVKRSPRYFETLSQHRDLPIMHPVNFNRFLKLYINNRVVAIAPQTGSGDSTQLIKRIVYLELHKNKQVVCTQPHHVAAKELGERLSAELDVPFGEEVGVQYRKYNKTSKQTRLKFVTEGMLLQQIGNDPKLANYSCLILDFHEPTKNVDPLLPLLKNALDLRSDLKVVIMSEAELEKFASYFNVPHTLGLGGGTPFPVTIEYISEATPDYCEMAFHRVNHIHKNKDPGDILVFLASNSQVDRAVAKLRGAIPDMETFPLHGRLSKAEKAKALRSGEKRRCVVTTNIAESTITVGGIVYVVDGGVEMQPVFTPRVRINTIKAAPISKPSADKRAACAGQSQPGICYRLYTKKTYDESLSKVSPMKDCFKTAILALKNAGIDSVGTFDFLDPANEEVYRRALVDVRAMNLIDENGTITPAGEAAATLPIDFIWHNTFEEAVKLGCLSELIDIAALASVKNPIFLRSHETQHAADSLHRQFMAPFSDHMTELNTLYTYLHTKRNMSTQELATWCDETFLSFASLEEALKLRQDLIRWCKEKLGVSEISVLNPHDKDYHVKIRKAIAKGFFHHAAIRDISDPPNQYRTLKNSPVWIRPNSALGGRDWEWVVYHKIEPTGFRYMDRCTVVDLKWLLENDYFYPVNLTKDTDGKVWLKPLQAILDAIGSTIPHKMGEGILY